MYNTCTLGEGGVPPYTHLRERGQALFDHSALVYVPILSNDARLIVHNHRGTVK